VTDSNPYLKKGMSGMNTDENAPVFAASEIEVAADPEVVWDLMTAIDRWPTWNPDVKWASLDGELTEGSTFHWKSGPGTITSTLQRVERPSLLAWTGRTLGIKATHIWRITDRDGLTSVKTEESWDGLIVRILRGPMQKTLEQAIDSGLKYLKAEVEKRVS
jgi:uncharacterized protein YndB with AHSA1/START domain